jgi:hypothetical protein
MIDYVVFVLIPLTLLLVSPAFQIVLSVFVLKGKVRLALFWVNFIALIAGFILPVCASVLSMVNLAPGPQCLTGNVAIAIFGWMITMVTMPIISTIFYIVFLYRKKHKLVESA